MNTAPGTQVQFTWAWEAGYEVRDDCRKDILTFLFVRIYRALSN